SVLSAVVGARADSLAAVVPDPAARPRAGHADRHVIGLILGYAGRGYVVMVGPRPPGSPGPVQDVHWAGAAMWVGGDAIMFTYMMIVVWMWARDERADSLGLGWLEAVRRSRFEELVAGQPAAAAVVGPGGEERPDAAGDPRPVASRGGSC